MCSLVATGVGFCASPLYTPPRKEVFELWFYQTALPTCVKAQQRCVTSPVFLWGTVLDVFTPWILLKTAFISHVTVFFSKDPPSPSPTFFLLSIPLAHFRFLLSRPLHHLPNKVPTRNKTSLFKGATASTAFLSSLLSSPALSLFFFPTRLCLRSSACGLCSPTWLSLDRFMTLLWNLLK